MTQIIVKFDSNNKDVQICSKSNGEVIFKNISLNKLMDLLIQEGMKYDDEKKDMVLLDHQIIGVGRNYVVINQPECRKIVTYIDTGSYRINFPNAIYIMHFYGNKIQDIQAFSYIEYKGLDTNLYEYPMPNELSGNKICMGSADRKIVNQDYTDALERIIATQYTHSHFSGVKGFSDTVKWFEYLQKNKFPYKLLRKLNMQLKDIRV